MTANDQSALGVRNVRRAPVESAPCSVARGAPAGASSRAMRIVWAAVGFLMVVGMGGSVVWALRNYVKTSTRFAIVDIVTTGGKRHSPDELSAIAGLEKGENVFSVDLDKAKARLMADPWIENAFLSRQLPGTINLRVTERQAAGLVMNVEGYLVTRQGAIIKRLEAADPTDVPIVTGIAMEQFTFDREGASRTVRRALDLAADYEQTPLGARLPLQEIHVEPNGEMTLAVGNGPVLLRMGVMPYRRKLEQAERVMSELDRRGAKPDSIMLDNEGRPERVVVRMR
ncbi:MAG: FtsQ-type POTRA domain-containing protein [Polyangiaceae bacterium]|nr:FtsQ-type POTRA domain-containing protein [Polyangiaceae bacterium]